VATESTLYLITTGAMATTAPQAKISLSGGVTKTIVQAQTSASRPLWVVEYGVSFDANTALVPAQVELIDTFAIAATVTAHVAAGVQPFDAVSDAPASLVTLGTAATGYNASAEGTVTQSRTGDYQLVPPTTQWVKMHPLGRAFYVPVSHNVRLRVTSPSAVGCAGYLLCSE
jgi:hypothetical protein